MTWALVWACFGLLQNIQLRWWARPFCLWLPTCLGLFASSSGSRGEPNFEARKGPSGVNRNTKVFLSCSLSLSLCVCVCPSGSEVWTGERAERAEKCSLANSSLSLYLPLCLAPLLRCACNAWHLERLEFNASRRVSNWSDAVWMVLSYNFLSLKIIYCALAKFGGICLFCHLDKCFPAEGR